MKKKRSKINNRILIQKSITIYSIVLLLFLMAKYANIKYEIEKGNKNFLYQSVPIQKKEEQNGQQNNVSSNNADITNLNNSNSSNHFYERIEELKEEENASRPKQDSLTVKREELQQRIISSIKAKREIGQDISKTMTEVVNLQAKISDKEIEIYTMEVELQELAKKIFELKTKQVVLEEKKKQGDLVAKKRLRSIYMQDKNKNLEILLRSTDIVTFFSNYYMLEEIGHRDQETLKNIEKNKKKLDLISRQLKEYEIITKGKKEKQERFKKLRENDVILKNAKIKELGEQDLQIALDLDELEKEKIEVEKQIAIKIKSMQRIERYVGGTLMWPVPKAPSTSAITAYYNAGYSQGYPGSSHSGVDIAIPRSEVGKYDAVAAAEGRVVVSVSGQNGSKRSYGNYVIIDHGGGVYTLYAHANSVYVTTGQYVKQGEPIIQIGSTGNSTGPHLHFEVRIGGSSYSNKVDPLPYITTKKEPV